MSESASAHTHAHGHDHGHDFVEANKAFFNEHAHEHQHPDSRQLAHKNATALRKAYPALFDEDRTTVLDYACGTGALSQALCPYVKSIVGVDISQAAVDVYNARAADQGLAPEEMRAVCAELRGEPGELDGATFDLVVCCASYHHFPSIAATTRTLAHFLSPGGTLLVTDVRAAPDGRTLFKDTHRHIVPHACGLREEDVRAAFEGAGAGLEAFEMRDAFGARMRATGEETRWFVARGVKPAA
ncbi:S-adenosyl-L-methionine-dependent methyltransferase [Trametes meyenii]|nr:S-adenosyl-L-methionine-dependent methyltransferase [Trametes meyenii]